MESGISKLPTISKYDPGRFEHSSHTYGNYVISQMTSITNLRITKEQLLALSQSIMFFQARTADGLANR